VKAVNQAVWEANGLDNGEEEELEEEEWDGIVEEHIPRVDREDEYVDEEKYTTVTVEEVGITKGGFIRLEDESEDEERANDNVKEPSKGDAPKPENANGKKEEKPKTGKVQKKKNKKRNFRYENKAERNITHMKERRKNSAHAIARKRKK
jgi:ribosomal RNA-processing protein 17